MTDELKSKRVEFSKDMERWEVLGEWTEEEAKKNWPELQNWIHETQVFGFFRMVDIERLKIKNENDTDPT